MHSLKRFIKNRRRLVGLTFVVIASWTYWFIPPVWNLRDGTVQVTRWERHKGETQAIVGRSKANWIHGKTISKHVFHAIVVAEDARFYQHHGLDFLELMRSLETNLRRGRYARGGSTITQQIVKMGFLTRQKTLVRKAREAIGSLLTEQILSKNEILEWYINLAEFGDGVYGIRDAAKHYFKTKPELLTIQQAIHLALVLPSPNNWSKGLRQGDLTPFGHQRFATIATRMRINGYITDQQWQTAMVTGNFGNPIADSESYAQFSEEAADQELHHWLESEDLLSEPIDPGPGFVSSTQQIENSTSSSANIQNSEVSSSPSQQIAPISTGQDHE